MEYTESIIQGGMTNEIICRECGATEHKVTGIIKSAFFFVEFLPVFPVQKMPIIECAHCQLISKDLAIPRASIKQIKALLFPFYRLANKCIGLVIILLALGYWIAGKYEEQSLADNYIAAPEVNDFYFIDFRDISKNLRPKQKYRVAKVIDITGNTASLVFGNLFYLTQSAIPGSIRRGQVGNRQYFERKRYDFSFSQLKSMREAGTIFNAKRPRGNLIYGTPVFTQQKHFSSSVYYPGARQNTEGLAFQDATYVDDNYKTAFERFNASAQLGFIYGQVNLAEMYLSDKHGQRNVDLALYWFKQASMQSNKKAIEKYLLVCEKVPTCQIPEFYQALTDAGVNFHLNP
jgi:ribosomal protein L40E